jgi:hypothetical protein
MPEWRLAQGCRTCRKIEAEFAERAVERMEARRNASRVERETETAKLDPLPDPYILYAMDGTRQVFRAGGKRGPGRKAGVGRGRKGRRL